jgi:hypothetical protein
MKFRIEIQFLKIHTVTPGNQNHTGNLVNQIHIANRFLYHIAIPENHTVYPGNHIDLVNLFRILSYIENLVLMIRIENLVGNHNPEIRIHPNHTVNLMSHSLNLNRFRIENPARIHNPVILKYHIAIPVRSDFRTDRTIRYSDRIQNFLNLMLNCFL